MEIFVLTAIIIVTTLTVDLCPPKSSNSTQNN